MLQRIKEFLYSEKGQGIVEYALILAFVVAAAAVLTTNNGLSNAINAKIQNVITAIGGTGTGTGD